MNISKNLLSNPIFFLVLCLLGFPSTGASFQYDSFPDESEGQQIIRLLESGQAHEKNVPLSVLNLSKGEYRLALSSLDEKINRTLPWLESYLKGLIAASDLLIKKESDHFEFWVPKSQDFLADIALPSMESVWAYYKQEFQFQPKTKIRIEIYPTKDTFSAASTLSEEILERSGAIGICKFHRLMVLSPQALPLGYRWLDALSHEYTHLMVNELSDMRAELWIHEGTARYFETAYRLSPPEFLIPEQKSRLKSAAEKKELVSFKRMSPSLVYLKDQDEVSLAFAQVSYSVSQLVSSYSVKHFNAFLLDLKKQPFEKSFEKNFKKSVWDFEKSIHEKIAEENWEHTVGAMGDQVVFRMDDENDFVGADVKGEIRLGDRMRLMGRHEAALFQYQKALKQEPDNGVVLLKIARVQQTLGDLVNAEKHLRRAVAKNPNYITPMVDLARLVQRGESISLLQTALSINPFDPHVHELLVKRYTELGDKARSDYYQDILSRLLLANFR